MSYAQKVFTTGQYMQELNKEDAKAYGCSATRWFTPGYGHDESDQKQRKRFNKFVKKYYTSAMKCNEEIENSNSTDRQKKLCVPKPAEMIMLQKRLSSVSKSEISESFRFYNDDIKAIPDVAGFLFSEDAMNNKSLDRMRDLIYSPEDPKTLYLYMRQMITLQTVFEISGINRRRLEKKMNKTLNGISPVFKGSYVENVKDRFDNIILGLTKKDKHKLKKDDIEHMEHIECMLLCATYFVEYGSIEAKKDVEEAWTMLDEKGKQIAGKDYSMNGICKALKEKDKKRDSRLERTIEDNKKANIEYAGYTTYKVGNVKSIVFDVDL